MHGQNVEPVIKRLKTRSRCTLKNDMLNALLQVSINGPEVKDCQPLITTAVTEWLAKPRRKIANVPSRDIQQAQKLQAAGI